MNVSFYKKSKLYCKITQKLDNKIYSNTQEDQSFIDKLLIKRRVWALHHRALKLQWRSRRAAQSVAVQGGVLCRVLGTYKMFVSSEDRGLSPHLMLDGYWEMSVTNTILTLAKRGMNVADIGANVGYYSIILADIVGESGTVIAAEPNPFLANLLEHSARVNGVDGRTEIVREAITASSGEELVLNVPSHFPQNGHLNPGGNDTDTRVNVKTKTLDEVVGDRRIDLIKIDVEGSEENVWRGMQNILARKAPLVIILEFTPLRYANPEEFLSQFIKEGFGIFLINYDGWPSITPREVLDMLPGHIDRMLVLKR